MGTNVVPPLWVLVDERVCRRLVFERPSMKVLNCVGRRLRRLAVLGGGRIIESMPWIIPFVAGFMVLLVSA